jgi:c-di-GMP-binding flagellar brake protein YcgR
MGFDSRKYVRFTIPNAVSAKCSYTESGRRVEFQIKVVDISYGGAKIDTRENKIPPGTELEIFIELPDKKTISMRGKAIRTYRKPEQTMYSSSVKFDKVYEKLIKDALQLGGK